MSRLLLSTGDPNGIGPEIAVKAVARLGATAPVIVGDRCAVEAPAEACGLRLRAAEPGALAETGVCDVIDVGALSADELRVGQVRAEAGAATIAYARAAVRLASGGGFRGVVAGPHSETAVHAAGIAFAGYPPLIAELIGVPEERVFLMLVGGGLRVAHVTLHVSMAEALRRLTVELVTEAGLALHRALGSMGVRGPRLGMFGINCHAGEGGLFGDDDLRVTAPAAERLRAAGVDITDPVGADVLLGDPRCDGYLAMYHDQGHIPVKLLAGRGAAAVAIGAGVPFASVGHGPAFDIAGQGVADPSALLSALSLFGNAPQEAVTR
ncbi:MAG TPA: 4-hydroxythreonine-4-phosphate dehydrogenase PdxA [Amycolatopsis sp.]|uniref:PdxA family dehydrogenase n=1 Tax=Amycolatopsis sp. TaxID=37632 RepID=UPI002F4249C2